MVEFSRETVADLVNIHDHLGRDNPVRATKTAARITKKCRLLDKVPLAGRPGCIQGTRELRTAAPWVIIRELAETGPLYPPHLAH